MVKALERELGLFNIFFIEIGNRNFPFLNLLEAVKAVKGMRCVHCFGFHPSTSAYCRSILVIEVLGDAMVGWLFSLGGCCCCCSFLFVFLGRLLLLLFFAVCFPWAVVVVVVFVVVVLCCLFSLGGGRGCGCFPWAVDRISRICKTRLGITLAGKLLF